MNILLKIMLITLGCISIFYMCASVIIFSYATYNKRNLDREPILGINIFNSKFFFLGFFLGLSLLLSAGFEKALFFIPEHWGGLTEDGDWQSTRTFFSQLLAVMTIIILVVKLDKIKREK